MRKFISQVNLISLFFFTAVVVSLLLFFNFIISSLIQKFASHSPIVQKMNANDTSVKGNPRDLIMITSLNYHPFNQPDRWVDRIIGNRSLYLYRSRQKQVLDWHPIKQEEITNSTLAIRKILPKLEFSKTICSIELLGFIETDRIDGFYLSSKEKGPLMGVNTLVHNISLVNNTLNCYYRVLYENWRAETDKTTPNFWSMIFFCPIIEFDTCKLLSYMTLNESNSIISLSMNVKGIITNYTTSLYKDNKVIEIMKESPKVGVCVAIPYSSSDPEKIKANGAMLYTWIRYYLKLGFYVFVYDRGGMNYNYVFPQKKIENENTKLYYRNFTMRELLQPNEKFDYDNTEILVNHMQVRFGKTRQIRQYIQGYDKVLTLTRCRFDIKSMFNITDVIVADFDEFLYCPKAANSTANSQSNYIQYLIEKAKKKGYEQVTFSQRVLLNMSASTRDCMIDKVTDISPSNMTDAIDIFKCFAPYKYDIAGHSIKSLHLGYTCPLTGYHQACPTASPRAYECNCSNLNIFSEECSFVHITSNQADYIKGVGIYNDYQIETARNQVNELYTVYKSLF